MKAMADLQTALLWHQQGKLDMAEKAYRELLERDSDNADACNLLGMLLSSRGDEAAACGLFARAVDLFPNNVTYLLNLAASLARCGKAKASQETFQRTIALQPKSAETNARYGLFLGQLGRLAEAEPYLKRSVEADSGNAALWVNLGTAQRRLGKTDAAIKSFREAIKVNPNLANAWNSLGEALQASGETDAAIAAFREAVSLAPNATAAKGNLAVTLHRSGRLEEAAKLLEEACRQEPSNASLLASLAALYRDSCRIEESTRRFRDALELDPRHPQTVSKYLYTLNFHPGLAAEETLHEHQIADRCYSGDTDRSPRRVLEPGEPLRVALLSGDFCAHSVAYFLLHLMEGNERNRVAYFCYSETAERDSVNERFRAVACGWRDTQGVSASQVASWLKEDRIDILVDLAGHTAGSRLDIVAEAPTPIVLNWLGYPNRVGLSRYDGRIVDATTDPEDGPNLAELEPLWRLDGCFLAYKSPYGLPEVAPPPCLDAGRVTFGSFNNAAKLNGAVIELWSRILLEVPESRILLKSWQFGDDAFCSRIRSQFESRGVKPDRVELEARADSYQEHMALYGKIDIALDPFPYNGTTTTCEALWMGVPVVALHGDRHSARVGASLLRSAGMPDLVASDETEYMRIAIGLAANPAELQRMRAEQRALVQRSLLGDTQGFAQRFEALLWKIHQDEVSSPGDDERSLQEALALHKEGKVALALELYHAFLRTHPKNGDALHATGVAHYSLGDYSEAERLLAKAANLCEGRADILTHWGSALQQLGRAEEAIEAHEQALLVKPADSVILSNYGNALSDAGRGTEALRVFKRSLDANPDNVSVWINYSVALKECGHLLDAVDAARKAVELAPADAKALGALGGALVMAGEAEEAVRQFRAALRIEPANGWLWSNLIYALQYSDLEDNAELVEATLEFGKLFAPPPMKRRRGDRAGKLRVGFVSADLRQHAVARFLKPLLAERNAAEVEVYLYSDSAARDDWSAALERNCDAWRSIFGKTDQEVASLIDGDGVDFLIDLGGHSSRNRLSLFALKPAPAQATWLGFPGSTGLAAMDFRIADAISLSEAEAKLYPETPICLPNGFHTIAFPEAGDVAPTPSLEKDVFTFGSFNNLAKVSPATIRLWAIILNRAPNARLALKAVQLRDKRFRTYLLEKFAEAGADLERIALLDPEIDYAAHLDRYAEIDLCLDPLPYNGTTTTCEALYMGVPTVSLLGQRLSARVGASLLTEVGLDAFVCETESEYVDVAVSWATKAEELNVLRQRIRTEFQRSELGSARRFAASFFSSISQAYEQKMDEMSRDQGSSLPLAALDGWVELIEIDGLSCDGEVVYPMPTAFADSDLTGMRVIDVSCVDGLWAMESLRRGASEVACLPAVGFYSLRPNGTVELSRSSYVTACCAALGVSDDRMRLLPQHLFTVDPSGIGRFDWVLFNVNANQARHPLLAMDTLRLLCRGRLVLSIVVKRGDGVSSEPSLLLKEGAVWMPTMPGLRSLLANGGFEIESLDELELDAETALAVVCARPAEEDVLQ